MKKIAIIDSLRGIASLMVCLYHLVVYTKGLFPTDQVGLFFLGQHGVDIFFVISGVTISLSLLKTSYSLSDFRNFFSKRILRIEPPYIVSLGMGVAYLYGRELIPGSVPITSKPGLFDVSLHFGYLVPFFHDAKWVNLAYWTLAVEFQFYLFMSLIFPLLRSSIYSRISILALGLIVSNFLTDQRFLPVWMPLFLMGISAAFLLSELISETEFFVCATLCCAAIFHTRGVETMLFGILTALTIILFKEYENKLGIFFGKISYSLYLLHSIVGAAVLNLLSRHATTLTTKVGAVMVALIFTVSFSYVFYLLIEKPSQEAARQFGVK